MADGVPRKARQVSKSIAVCISFEYPAQAIDIFVNHHVLVRPAGRRVSPGQIAGSPREFLQCVRQSLLSFPEIVDSFNNQAQFFDPALVTALGNIFR